MLGTSIVSLGSSAANVATLTTGGNRLPIDSDVLFIDDLAMMLRTSRTTIERRRRDRSLPFPELPGIDRRPRWSRRVVSALMGSSQGVQRHRSFGRRDAGRN